MAIECNSIISEAEILRSKFKKCATLSALDLRTIMDLIISLKGCGSVVNYKVYRALLSQLGTNAPTVVVLENTLGGDVIWTRDSAGSYKGTLTEAFPPALTFCQISGNTTTPGTTLRILANPSAITVFSNSGFTSLDSNLNATSVEVLVYN